MGDDWYIIATVDDDARLDDEVSPIAVLGPCPRALAQQKVDRLRAKYPGRQFDIRPEGDVEIDRVNGRVRTALRG